MGPETRHRIGLLAGPLFFVLVCVAPPQWGLAPEAWIVFGVAGWMAVYWISEALPFAVTAMLPLVLFPLCGIMEIEGAAAPFAHPIIFLFLGGVLIALGLERSGLHKRIALAILAAVGTRPSGIIFGFLLASAFLSMWINNTATAVMMLPIGISVIRLLASDGQSGGLHFAPALMLAIAYGANIGGCVTIIGTAPNAIFAGFVRENYGYEIGFAQWMLFGVPLAGIMLPAVAVVLCRVAFRLPTGRIEGAAETLANERSSLGPMSRAEKLVACVFTSVAALWITRPLIPLPGLGDTVIAMAGGLVLFLLPSGRGFKAFVLDWETAKKIPWDVLLLIGGGLSLARGIQETGLADAVGHWTSGLDFLPFVALVVLVPLVILLLTELTSNTATTATFLPVVGSVALGMGGNPVLLTAVAALAASGAFMLPVATPPNAIVFASGKVSVPEMIRAGALINLLFWSVLCILALSLGPRVFGFAG